MLKHRFIITMTFLLLLPSLSLLAEEPLPDTSPPATEETLAGETPTEVKDDKGEAPSSDASVEQASDEADIGTHAAKEETPVADTPSPVAEATSGEAAQAAASETDPASDAALATEAAVEFDEFGLEEEFGTPESKEVFDPLSGYNRVMTKVNDKLYFWVLKPVATGYRAVVPEPARRSVVRFFNNLLFPVRFVNNVLQLKFKGAGVELSRFCINTTVGVLGLGDPAKGWFDLDPYPEDFGQTLGHYGVRSGFHIVLPLLGPSNLRDMAGLVPDYYLDPVTYAVEEEGEEFAVRSLDKVNYTSLHLGEYESLKKDAVDFYTFMRDAYEQNRQKKIEE